MAALQPGTRLGPYEIVDALGAGGMGEVYQAIDTRLNRGVAIKHLNTAFNGDPSRRARFEREALAIASLSHPNICTLYDVGHHGEDMFLVMELLQGESLAQRLSRTKNGMPLDEVMSVASDIARGLAAAHRQGVVHRDVKPGNIMLTPSGAKVLDFGIARPVASATDATRHPITQLNERIGTPVYMAPEQLIGQADHRSDIFAFGAVVFEMLTGAKAFSNYSSQSPLRSDVSPSLDRLVRKCLEKDPDRRWQSSADLADELNWISTRPTYPKQVTRSTPARSVGVAGIIALTVIVVAMLGRQGSPQVSMLSIVAPAGITADTTGPGVAIAPDGMAIAFAAGADANNQHVFVKRLDAAGVQPIPGTEGARYPFFSPDGRDIGFFADGKLKKVTLASGAVATIADLGDQRGGGDATWSSDGTILFGTHADRPTVGIRRVSLNGVGVETLTKPDNSLGEQTHYGAQRVPGSNRIIYTVRSRGASGLEFKVVAADADGSNARTIIPGASLARILETRSIIYQLGDRLMLAPFDTTSLSVGTSKRVINDVFLTASGAAWSIGDQTLVYRPVEPPRRHLTWLSRDGTIEPLPVELQNYSNVVLSPKGDRLASNIQDGARTDTWIIDLPKQIVTRLTQEGRAGSSAVWAGDESLIFQSRINAANGRDIIAYATDGSGAQQTVLESAEQTFVADLSGDQQLFSIMSSRSGTGPDIFVMPRSSPHSLRPIVQTPAVEYGGRISPNGKWMAYFSNASGRNELYVTPFPDGGPRWQVSRTGAREAVWSRDGSDLFYRSGNRMMAASIHDSDGFSWDPPRELFSGQYFQQGGPGNVQYDVAPDGRFLMIEESAPGPTAFNVVQGWRAIVQ